MIYFVRLQEFNRTVAASASSDVSSEVFQLITQVHSHDDQIMHLVSDLSDIKSQSQSLSQAELDDIKARVSSLVGDTKSVATGLKNMEDSSDQRLEELTELITDTDFRISEMAEALTEW